MNQYQITSRPRHLRHIFFIDSSFSHESLLELMYHNQRLWGGRYNPIVPVNNNKISNRYLELAECFDPDYVFYTENIDVDIIKDLKIFNPHKYINLDSKAGLNDVWGVNALYLLSKFDQDSKILMPDNLWQHENLLKDFYRINFGLIPISIAGDSEICKDYSQIHISGKNFSSLNEIISKERPLNRGSLSKLNLNTSILRNLQQAKYDSFEIVVAEDNSSIDDLLYYWNRQLFQCQNILFATFEELKKLAEDEHFGYVLSNMTSERPIQIVSRTLEEDQVKELIQKHLNNLPVYNRFEQKRINAFPFEILDTSGLYERNFGESPSTQTLISDEGLYHLPKLSFTDSVDFYPQKWAIDLEGKNTTTGRLNFKLPFTADTKLFFKDVGGRVNKNRNVSIFIHNQKNKADTLNLRIPSFLKLSRQLLSRPKIQGELKDTRYVSSSFHDDSYRLSAFLKLFDSNFIAIEDYFSDKFWVDIFEDLCKSNKDAGDTIIFEELKRRSLNVLEENDIELGEKEETFKNEENLEYGLKYTLKELNDHQIFFKGYNLKCTNCSTKFWYHIDDVSEKVICKGCLQEFSFPIETDLAYKLNDLVKNNIFQSKTQKDGNLTVIRTLVNLNRRSRQSFTFMPQINLYEDIHSNKPSCDIDIFCLVDGKLVIGEAKHDSAAFFDDGNKSLKSLVDISKEIYPERIILSCYEDSHGKLENAKKSLTHYFDQWQHEPEIETLALSKPDYFDLKGPKYFYY